MMRTLTLLLQKNNRKNMIFRGVFIIFGVILLSLSAYGDPSEKITTIQIVTPAWEGQTNEDGTGLYFEIVRKVYEPVGIKMTYEIFPWKRALDKVVSNEADALLAEYENEDLLMPRYPLDVERTSVVFKKEKIKTWNGVKTLEGKKVAWLRGYDYHDTSVLTEAGIQFQWYEVDKRIQAWKMLEKGRVDFYMDAFVDIEQSIEDNSIDMTPYQVETAWTINIYMGFAKSKRSEKLIEIYDKRIPELLESDELKKLFEKWDIEFPPFKPENE